MLFRSRGKAFGKAMEFVQDDLRKQTHLFDSKVSMFKNGSVSKDEFLKFGDSHVDEMIKIILRYDNLQIPQPFVSAVELFKLSAETQLESDKYMIEWVSTSDDTTLIRSDQLLHQSFEYEQAALLEFNLVQSRANP